jgi:hypothetical protein
MISAFTIIVAFIFEIEKSVQLSVGPNYHAPPVPSVPAVGPAFWNVFFPAETDAPVSTVSAAYENLRFINELHEVLGGRVVYNFS